MTKKTRTFERRIQQIWHDIFSILKLHGPKVFFAYCLVKVSAKIPFLSSAIHRLFNGKILVRIKVLGSWMYVNLLDPGISYQLLIRGVRELAHVEQIQQALKAGMKGIDLGANIGYYVLIEGRLVGQSGHIYCIEPAPDNMALLRKNIATNGFEERTSAYQRLVGDKNGMERLYLSAAANSHSVSEVTESFVEVPMVTLDHFIGVEHIDPATIDFLRMDIEGYEVMVVQHMYRLLSGRTTPLKLFIELHPSSYQRLGWTLGRLLNYLEGLGFVIQSVVQEAVVDSAGRKTDRIVHVASAQDLAAKFEIWKRSQSGIWAFLEFPGQR